MNIGKYGLSLYTFESSGDYDEEKKAYKTKINRIYTAARIVAIVDGKYCIAPLHLGGGHTLEVKPEEFYIIERKNS